MNRLRQKEAAAVVVCAMILAGSGCNREPSQPPRLSPEESFDVIAQIVKDGIEIRGGGGATTIVTEDTGARTRFSVVNTVDSQIFPPAEATDPYRATITVTSKSVYTLSRTVEDEKRDEEVSSGRNDFSLLDEMDDSNDDTGVMDNSLVMSPSDEEKAESSEIRSVQRRADEEVRAYDFVYQDGHWMLTSKLDPKTERSVQNAIERALRLQP